MQVSRYPLGAVTLQNGQVLHDAWLSYATWGTLNAAGDNCVLFPTYYTGTHLSNARIIGQGRALDPDNWFIVVPNLIGNGLSISPSNTLPQYRGGGFPQVTIYDNVACQHALLDFLGVQEIRLALGWSMGGLQAWHWAALYPNRIRNLLPICAASRCWPYNQMFLKSMRGILEADANYQDGYYSTPPVAGLRAFGRAYAPWAYSAAFFRDRRYLELGLDSQDALLQDWEQDHLQWDANDLLAKLWSWQHADVSAHAQFAGDLSLALGNVSARTILMPCDHDQYFTLDENRMEAALIPRAEVRPILSSAGHCAGAPGRFSSESAYIDSVIRELLEAA